MRLLFALSLSLSAQATHAPKVLKKSFLEILLTTTASKTLFIDQKTPLSAQPLKTTIGFRKAAAFGADLTLRKPNAKHLKLKALTFSSHGVPQAKPFAKQMSCL
jgi:hypothetical protein